MPTTLSTLSEVLAGTDPFTGLSGLYQEKYSTYPARQRNGWGFGHTEQENGKISS